MNKSQRKRIIDEVPHYRCSSCLEYKTKDNFTGNSASPDGLQYSCKECYRRKYQENDGLNVKLENYQVESTKQTAIMLLEAMGYDVSKDVSEQFYKKIKDKYGIELS